MAQGRGNLFVIALLATLSLLFLFFFSESGLTLVSNESRQSKIEKSTKSASNAYVTYATDGTYFCAALVNLRRLADLKAIKNVDRVIIVPDDVEIPVHLRESADKLGVKVHILPPMPDMSFDYYRDVQNKLLIFKLTQYKSVIFFDSDGLILKPLNDLFHHKFLTDEYVLGVKNYWEYPLKDVVFTTMLMLVRPSDEQFDKLEEIIKNTVEFHHTMLFDMDLLNKVYGPTATLLSPYYGALTAHWCHNWTHVFDDLDHVLQNDIKYIHMTGPGKLWSYDSEEVIFSICKSQLKSHQDEEWRKREPHRYIKNILRMWLKETKRTCGNSLLNEPLASLDD